MTWGIAIAVPLLWVVWSVRRSSAKAKAKAHARALQVRCEPQTLGLELPAQLAQVVLGTDSYALSLVSGRVFEITTEVHELDAVEQRIDNCELVQPDGTLRRFDFVDGSDRAALGQVLTVVFAGRYLVAFFDHASRSYVELGTLRDIRIWRPKVSPRRRRRRQAFLGRLSRFTQLTLQDYLERQSDGLVARIPRSPWTWWPRA